MRSIALGAALLAASPGCSALVNPDVSRLGDGGPVAPSSDGGGCPGSTLACGAVCADPASDPAHCGGCGRVCGPGSSCVSGVCVCPPGAPGCAPLGDPDRCAGRTCRDDQVCAAGTCVCRPGLTPVGTSCVDLASDPDHCGAVGRSCPEVCAGGLCVARCPDGLMGCDGACVDVSISILHCGECGRACDRDQVCVAGRCRDYVAAGTCDACGGDTPTCCDYAMSRICVESEGCPR